MGLRVLEILGRMGFQRELHLGAASVLFMWGLRMWMATCSVRSSCDLEVRDFIPEASRYFVVVARVVVELSILFTT